jgi:hypothetical protein
VAFSMPKVSAQPAAPLDNAASVAETVFTAPSPCASADCGAPSGLTSHSTRYASEAEASSCSEVSCVSPTFHCALGATAATAPCSTRQAVRVIRKTAVSQLLLYRGHCVASCSNA